jgi:hypothetical protein
LKPSIDRQTGQLTERCLALLTAFVSPAYYILEFLSVSPTRREASYAAPLKGSLLAAQTQDQAKPSIRSNAAEMVRTPGIFPQHAK